MVWVRGRRLSRGILATFERGKQRMNEYTVIEKHDGWAEVVLARPARKNAIVPPMAIEVATAVNGLSTQQDVAAIVIRGSDGAFCSGVDLKVLQSKKAILIIWASGTGKPCERCITPCIAQLSR